MSKSGAFSNKGYVDDVDGYVSGSFQSCVANINSFYFKIILSERKMATINWRCK